MEREIICKDLYSQQKQNEAFLQMCEPDLLVLQCCFEMVIIFAKGVKGMMETLAADKVFLFLVP